VTIEIVYRHYRQDLVETSVIVEFRAIASSRFVTSILT